MHADTGAMNSGGRHHHNPPARLASILAIGLLVGCSSNSPALRPITSDAPATPAVLVEPEPSEQQRAIAALATADTHGSPLDGELPGEHAQDVRVFLSSADGQALSDAHAVIAAALLGDVTSTGCASLVAAVGDGDELTSMVNAVSDFPEESLASPAVSMLLDAKGVAMSCESSPEQAQSIVSDLAWQWSIVARWLRAVEVTP